MKKCLVIAGVFLSGCVSGPTAYDGVLGYRFEAQPAGAKVTYVDEARVGSERVLGNIAKVCSAKLGQTISPANLKVLSEDSFEQQVNISIQIPVGSQSNGSEKPSPGSGGAVPQIMSPVNRAEGIIRTMKLKKIVALCAVTP